MLIFINASSQMCYLSNYHDIFHNLVGHLNAAYRDRQVEKIRHT